jgi:hypothetical protein
LTGASAGEDFQLVEEPSELASVKETASAGEDFQLVEEPSELASVKETASAGEDFQLVEEPSELASVKETADADDVCSKIIIVLNKFELLLGERFGVFRDGAP